MRERAPLGASRDSGPGGGGFDPPRGVLPSLQRLLPRLCSRGYGSDGEACARTCGPVSWGGEVVVEPAHVAPVSRYCTSFVAGGCKFYVNPLGTAAFGGRTCNNRATRITHNGLTPGLLACSCRSS